MTGSVMGIELKKLTFIGGTDVSVSALGLSNLSATFDDCEWSGQSTGKVSVLTYNSDRSNNLEVNLSICI
eukprot:4339372-Ditylum_brightwellii.AAC.1